MLPKIIERISYYFVDTGCFLRFFHVPGIESDRGLPESIDAGLDHLPEKNAC